MRLIISLLALASPLVFITLASAHAAPERFDPSPGAVLPAAPPQVQGWFIQDVRRQAEASFIKVFDAGGMQVYDKSPVVDDTDRRHVSAKLESGLGPGRYMVAWQTLSDEDDELDGGCYWFFVGQAAADKAHEEKLRINAPDGCPINLEEASALFTKPDAMSATIKMDVPAEVNGPDLTVNLSTEGVTIRPPTGSGKDPKFAHYHLYVDRIPVLQHSHGPTATPGGTAGMPSATAGGMAGMPSATPGGMAGMATATPGGMAGMATATATADYSRDIMVPSDSYTLKGLSSGHHVLSAALFYDDHMPFDPPVITSVAFTVAGAHSDGEGGGTGTATVIVIAIAAAGAGLLAGGGLAWSQRRR